MDTKEIHDIVDRAIERADLTRLGAYKAAYDKCIENKVLWAQAETKAVFESIAPFVKETLYLVLEEYDRRNQR